MTQIPCLFFSFFFFFFFFFYHVLCINQPLGTKTTCSASYCKERTPSPTFLQPGTREKAINPSLSSIRPTTHQPRKIRNPPPTRRSKRKIQINTWGGINRKPLAVDTNKINNCYNQLTKAKVTDNKRRTMGERGLLLTIVELRALLENPRR